MTSPLFDLRLVLGRDDRWHVSIDGRSVPMLDGAQPSDVLHMLARKVRAAAWRSDRTEAEEMGDEGSVLYSPGHQLVAHLRGEE